MALTPAQKRLRQAGISGSSGRGARRGKTLDGFADLAEGGSRAAATRNAVIDDLTRKGASSFGTGLSALEDSGYDPNYVTGKIGEAVGDFRDAPSILPNPLKAFGEFFGKKYPDSFVTKAGEAVSGAVDGFTGAADKFQEDLFTNVASNARYFTSPAFGSGSSAGEVSPQLGNARVPGDPARPNQGPAATLQQDMEEAELRREGKTTTEGGGGVDLSSIFSPLFKALDQQRTTANSRYNANVTGITNIYGQLVGARNDDIPTIDAAYKRLQSAAASRGEADINAMSDRESERLSNNNAVLQSMGVEDTGDVSGGVAAQGSQAAIDTETMNQSNWSGMLDSMGAASKDMARADATSFGFRQGEDIAKLQGAKEDRMSQIDGQEFQLESQKLQAQQQAQQAAAAASARAEAALANATNKANADAAAHVRDVINNGDPLTKTIFNRLDTGQLDDAGATNVQAAYFDWMAVRGTDPTSFSGGNTRWNKGSAIADALSYSGGQLTQPEKTALMEAIGNSF